MSDKSIDLDEESRYTNLKLLYDFSSRQLFSVKEDMKILDARFALVLSALAAAVLLSTSNDTWGLWSFCAASKLLFVALSIVSLIASLSGMSIYKWRYGADVNETFDQRIYDKHERHPFLEGMVKNVAESYKHNKEIIRKKSQLFMVAFWSAAGLIVIVLVEALAKPI